MLELDNKDFRKAVKVVKSEMRARGMSERFDDPCPNASRKIAKITDNINEPHTMLYLVQSTELFKIKIGITTTHQRGRFTVLKGNSPSRLKLIGMVRCDSRQQALDIETVLKMDMRRWHSHGEWFNESERVWEILSEYNWEENPYTDSINEFLNRVNSNV